MNILRLFASGDILFYSWVKRRDGTIFSPLRHLVNIKVPNPETQSTKEREREREEEREKLEEICAGCNCFFLDL